jgi:8-oxo-dGTP pyrophosphatase MutT (NUDIX family)/nicotinamide mononucleotide adenylyltransferase
MISIPSLAVISAKFQAPTLTVAQEGLIFKALNDYDEVLIVLGSNRIVTDIELLKYEWRVDIIKKIFEDDGIERITFANLYDVYNKERWSVLLDEIIDDYKIKKGNCDVTLLGGRDSFLDTYVGKYTHKERYSSMYGDTISATNMRNSIEYTDNVMFRKGMFFQAKRAYATAFPTVDIAVIDGRGHILLGKRSYESKYRFIGGVSEPDTQSHEIAAVKELEEEAHIIADESKLKYVYSSLVNDPRRAKGKDKFKTILFTYEYDAGFEKGDDMDGDMKWFDINSINPEVDLMEVHRPLWKIFRTKSAF